MTTSHKTQWRESLMKQEVETTTIKDEWSFVVCEKCRTAIPPQMLSFQYDYCPACGRKITRKLHRARVERKEGEG